MFPVEYVFPYVNPDREKWQKAYKYCKGMEYDNDVRFRDFSFLKYVFRSIEIYAPWINRVRIIVSDMDQLPEWLNPKAIKLAITLHKDFIPSEYLPTFNSNTIEMFTPNLPTTEHFLYSNDDLLFLNPTTVEDFFTLDGEQIKLAYRESAFRDLQYSTFSNICLRSWELVFNERKIVDGDTIYGKQFHGVAAPRLLSDCKKCFEDHKDDILDSLTMFRNFEYNYNQYIYGYESILLNHCTPQTSSDIGLYLSLDTLPATGISRMLKTSNNKMVCINDTSKMKKRDWDEIQIALEEKFPNKSSFEL